MPTVTGQPVRVRTVQAGTAAGTVVRCTPTDTLLGGMAASAVWLFEQAPEEDRLADGLARALALLPVFAGRLRTGPRGDLEIVCDDSGARMVTMDVPDTLAEAVGRMALPTVAFADPVEAGPDRAPDGPLLAVRASRLADGGLALGCSWHHAVGDLASLLLLMRAWSASVDGRPAPDVRIDADRSAALGAAPAGDRDRPSYWMPDLAEAAELAGQLRSAPMTSRIVQVFFAGAEVDRMRAAYSAEAGRPLSANDALVGHLVGAVRRLDGDPEARRLTMPVDFRRHAGLPAAAVGNLVSELVLDCPPAVGPAALAGLLRAAVEVAGTQLDVRANAAFLAGIGPDRRYDWLPVAFDPARRTFSIRNWSRAGAYELTFGGQRPAFFGPPVTVPVPWAGWVTEGFGGAGHLATVVLPARLAGKLRADPGLHAFREPADELPPLARGLRRLA